MYLKDFENKKVNIDFGQIKDSYFSLLVAGGMLHLMY